MQRRMTLNDNTFSFIDIIKVLIKRWKQILIGTLTTAIITAVISLIIPRSYKATASLIIWESKIGSDGVLSNYFNPRYYYTFEGLVKNKDLAQKVINKFNLQSKPYEMNIDDFLENVSVALLRNSKVIELNVYFPDAQKAADIANFLASESVELNNSLNVMDIHNSRATISNQLEEARKNLLDSETTLAEFKAIARTKELETEIEILLYKLADLEIRHLDISLKIDSQNASNLDVEIEKAKKALQEYKTSSNIEILANDMESLKEIRKELQKKKNTDQSAEKLIDQNEKQIAELEKDLSEKELKYTILQDNFDKIRNSFKSSEDKSVEVLKKEIKSIEEKTSETKQMLIEKQKLLAEYETQLETKTLKYETDQQLFKKIKSKYEESALKISEKSQDIRIIDHAHTPSYADYPKKKLMVIIASVMAFLAFCLLFLIKERISID